MFNRSDSIEYDEPLSEDVQEIITSNPHWIVRRGISYFFVFILVLLGLSWFIKYPEVVRIPVHVAPAFFPTQIKSTAESRLSKLLVHNNQEVKQGQVLAYLQSSASPEDVAKLRLWLNKLFSVPPENIQSEMKTVSQFQLCNLGELQQDYIEFVYNINSKLALNSLLFSDKKLLLNNELKHLEQAQAKTTSERKQNAGLKYNVKTDTASPLNSKIPLDMKTEVVSQDNQMLDRELLISNVKKELIDLERTAVDQRQQILSSILSFKNAVEQWENKFVITAPETGTVRIASTLKENQLVYIGQELFSVQTKQSDYYVEGWVTQKVLSKIALGQRVKVEMPNFSGTGNVQIEGTINDIIDTSEKNDSLLLRINLPENFMAAQNKQSIMFHNQKGTSEIMVKDRRVLELLISRLKR